MHALTTLQNMNILCHFKITSGYFVMFFCARTMRKHVRMMLAQNNGKPGKIFQAVANAWVIFYFQTLLIIGFEILGINSHFGSLGIFDQS